MYTILLILGIILFTIGGIGWIRSADEGNNSKFIAVALTWNICDCHSNGI